MEQNKIDRINALARKERSAEGLTAAESAEQKALRVEYVAAFRASLKGQLDGALVLNEDGTTRPLRRKDAGAQ